MKKAKMNVLARSRKEERNRIYALEIGKWYLENIKKPLPENAEISLQLENSKLQPTEKIGFLIFSLPSVFTCPGATFECMRNCYARRDERFPDTREGRLNNWKISKKANFVDLMEKAIIKAMHTEKTHVLKTGKKGFAGKKVVFRLHESGDFYSVAYMLKWFEIARRFPNIQFFTYTKSFDILEKCIDEKPENFFIRASVWNDTNEKELAIIEKLAMNTYTATEKIHDTPKKNICDCEGGCGACGCKCAFMHENIVTEIH